MLICANLKKRSFRDHLLERTILAVLHIRLFGGLVISQNEALLTKFISNKVPALLAYLAVTRRPHQRDTLAALLWGEMADADAKNNLRQALSNLRKLISPHLLVTRETIGWNTAVPYTLDVEQFEGFIKNLPVGNDPDAAHPLEQAAALYRGDFLAGVYLRDAPEFEEWALGQRARWRELALTNLHTLTKHHLEQGRYDRAIDYAARLLALDPWREEAHRQLMLALVRSDQRTAAMKQYETCRQVLDEELGVEPSSETTNLYERIRAAGSGPRHNLPLAPTTFVGREAELAQIESWMLQDNGRLLTLIGPGGVGKTRLALQAAQARTADFLEGIWYVSLYSLADEGGLAAAVAAAVGHQFASADNLEEQLLDYLNGKEMLLVLDNLEHLLKGRTLSFLASILSRATAVKLLVTSRQRLNLQAETLLELHGLAYSVIREPSSVIGSRLTNDELRITQFPAVQLFVERARQVQADFEPGEQEGALLRLCQLVGGLPLALELAASWVRLMDVSGIAAEIEQGVDFLAAAVHDLPERHRSLQAVFDYSWQLLTSQEQTAYTILSVFRGGFSREAALAVTGARLSLLAGLLDKSLLRRDDDGRYRRHPLLLQFARAKLAQDTELLVQARQQHARYFGRFIRELEPVLMGGRPDEALALIRPELANLRLAWQTAVVNRDTAVINDLADSFMQIFDLLGLYQEMCDLAGQAVAALADHVDSTQAEDALALGRVYGLYGAFHFRLGEYTKATNHCQVSMQLIAPFQPQVAYGHSLIYAGAAAFGLGDFQQVVDYWQQAVNAYRAAGSTWGECVAQSDVAEVMVALGNTAAARKNAAAAYALAQQMENAEQMANSLLILSSVALKEKELDKAAEFGQQALGYHQKVGHKAHVANDLANLARIAGEKGEVGQAMAYLHESIVILRQIGNKLYLKQRLTELGQMALAAGQLDTAEAALQEVLAQAVKTNAMNLVSDVLLLLAKLRQEQGCLPAALRMAAFVAGSESANAEMRAASEEQLQSLAIHFTAEEMTAVRAQAAALSLAEIVVESRSLR